jgi:hypothetical protein
LDDQAETTRGGFWLTSAFPWKFDPDEVLRTVEAPDAVVPGRTADRLVSGRRLHDPKKGKLMLLLAVAEDAPDARAIVSVYHTSLPQRYLRGQP